MRIRGYVIVTLKFRKENNNWTAYCEELGTATFARSLKKAQEKIIEAVELHLNTLEEVGERERFFRDHKIITHSHRPRKNEITITGPFEPETLASPFIYPLEKEMLNI